MAILRGEKGISDILAILFMLIFAIFAGVLLHAYRFDAVMAATDRQLQLKSEYLYRTLELSQVENYSLTHFQAIAENLIGVSEPVIPEELLRDRIENVLEYIRPTDCGVIVELEHENKTWLQTSPPGIGEPAAGVARFTFFGEITYIIAEAEENRVAQVSAYVTIFKL